MLDVILAYLGLVALVVGATAVLALLAVHLTAWAIVRLLGAGDD